MTGIHISTGNSKMGKVASISLPPGLSCAPGVPCLKGCYAAKIARLRPCVRKSWMRNWRALQQDCTGYFRQIRDWIGEHKIKMFRWHVGGDIPHAGYLSWMVALAYIYPRIKFLAFTKRREFLYGKWKAEDFPPNLRIVVSMWPGMDDTDTRYPKVYMRDKKNPDPRIPKDAKECPGNCEKCGLCWHLKPGQSVVFDKH